MTDMFVSIGDDWFICSLEEELEDEDARFLVLRRRSEAEGKGEALGYVHFRFVDEEGAAMLYVYELQLDARVRR
eukprot:CAMPEP_0118957472 /NCGR_PEP_ID=MMETSP1169-20130426/62121_1 /TAXON_ID=36882 /ORGANISM="Pyramimonas obovata, Strain CCMP722" /LENGTH=73 /DNA_ID=CAMNT_0006905555 /DNA_START=2412 /DNA_END=2633 /DNA_ORIENTATION=+